MRAVAVRNSTTAGRPSPTIAGMSTEIVRSTRLAGSSQAFTNAYSGDSIGITPRFDSAVGTK
jgi:hypothetical protein